MMSFRIALLLLTSVVFAQQFFPNYPQLEWQVKETKHFYVHYTSETAWTAQNAAKIADEVFPAICEFYNFTPPKKYNLVLKDVDDYANGGAYFFNDKIEIWAQNLDYPMRGTSHWLYNVLTHELTHMVNIQASMKSPKRLPYGFLQWFAYEKERRSDVIRGFPNVIVSYPLSSVNIPVWFAEGTAQYQNPDAKYDYRDSHREMIMRDRFRYDEVLSYNDMGVFGKNSHGNETNYNQGYSFVDYLTKRFGDSVLSNIIDANARWENITFEASFEEATGVPADTVFADWKSVTAAFYNTRLATIAENMHYGKGLERDGFANLYPRFSPDARQVAYLSNKKSDYWSQNQLLLKTLGSGEEKVITSYVASGPAFSPDGRYLVYSKIQPSTIYGNNYHDLYIYDLEEEEEYQISKGLRARHPDWSVNNELVFVISQDGTGMVYRWQIDTQKLAADYQSHQIEIHSGKVHPGTSKGRIDAELRTFDIRMDNLPEAVTTYKAGVQYYLPRFSPDGKKLVYSTSNGWGRSIQMADLVTGKVSAWLDARADVRDPAFGPDGNRIYFTSDKTGIFNLYSCTVDGSDEQLHTNVIGGAFLPDLRADKLVYAYYDSIGYKIHHFDEIAVVDPALATYREDYPEFIPQSTFTNDATLMEGGENYNPTFKNYLILPRLFIDYGTIKPGAYLINTDPLDRWTFIAGFGINMDLERDIYLNATYNGFLPSVYIEMFNTTAKTKDAFETIIGGTEGNYDYLRIPREVRFNLLRLSTGAELTFGPNNLRAELIYNKYDATISNEEVFEPVSQTLYEDFDFSYTYLKGPQLSLSYSFDSRKRDRFTDIAPLGGRYAFARVTHEHNQFIDGIEPRAVAAEKFIDYNFNRFELTWEEFFRVPGTRYHSFSLRFTGGAIDQSTDDFFNFYAGGLLGMRGYSYFSIGGRFMAQYQASYKFPLLMNIDKKFLFIHLNHLFVNVYGDFGNAWDEVELPSIESYKKDVGVQLRLDVFSYQLFPTRVFFDVAYPLDTFNYVDPEFDIDVRYQREPRFYFGILFDFDFRERIGGPVWRGLH
jgi:Tol biopolymer transport system component